MQITAKANCPLNGFAPCRKLDCGWFIQLRGTHPNTGEPIDEWGCAMAWQPILMIETAQQQRQTGAALESLRNLLARGPQAQIGPDYNASLQEIGTCD